MNNHKTLLDTDYEEYRYQQDHPPKSIKTCGACIHSECLSSDMECEFCGQFDKSIRMCKCNTVQEGKSCPYYEKKRRP